MPTYVTEPPPPADIEAVRLYTYETAADVLAVSRTFLLSLVRDGELEKVTLSPRAVRVTARSVAAYIERKRDAA